MSLQKQAIVPDQNSSLGSTNRYDDLPTSSRWPFLTLIDSMDILKTLYHALQVTKAAGHSEGESRC
jgi:hypothetical protein